MYETLEEICKKYNVIPTKCKQYCDILQVIVKNIGFVYYEMVGLNEYELICESKNRINLE